ncbi:MAG: hypothetical protein F4187_02625 [Gemmatimonadetes bacterium]|nr:hypothetical protein [Gemmatimonadota bacterium]MYI06900.1 hypothetical protein [Gemmatimonadota bacterium]
MEGRYTKLVSFHVRTVSLQQLAALWSTVLASMPEGCRGEAVFERSGQSTKHEYIFRDADELAHAGLEVAPGELRLKWLDVDGPGTRVGIREREGSNFLPLAALLVLPSSLWVTIAGSDERDVLRIRDVVERWVGQNLTTTRRALCLKLGALAGGIVAIWAGAGVSGFFLDYAIGATALWIAGVMVASLVQSAVPALRRRTLELRILNEASPAGGGSRNTTSVTPDC